jgi:hypothetical protein
MTDTRPALTIEALDEPMAADPVDWETALSLPIPAEPPLVLL